MSENRDLLKEIAAIHGVGVTPDDPLLIIQTLNKRLMEDSAKAQQEMLDRYKEEMEALAKRWSDQAKDKAEKILNVALDASQKMMAKAAQEGGSSVAAVVNKEIEGSLDRAVRTVKGLVIANVIAAAITLVATFLTLWVRL
ncbi:MAG: conjugal transfer protein TraM [Syntrophobacteraceae bacterium]